MAALARLMDLLRRSGKLSLCPKFLAVAEKAMNRANDVGGRFFAMLFYDF